MSRYAPREYEVTIEGETVRALVEVSGRWIAGSLEYGPPEAPDASITKAWRCEGEDGVEREIVPASLTIAEIDALLDAALTKDQERDDVAGEEP
jgi:hypothetical protein